ncbi:diheme cytochrome c [Imhoffiella purpurea]|uniref:Diheme cytochrome c n=1 Tax=Imhoffiella purpurea TaxID=1249627 RepID=W9V7P0_9GAMM|nr:diheme cytochrome c [Imhoffiella purpurea]EXJ15598.1 diheme cytochrome c [Imhoffiella purpurea]
MKPPKIALLIALGMVTLGGAGLAISDDDDRDGHRGGHHHERHDGWFGTRTDIAPITNQVYAEECGSCHMAYQPGLLPAQSWAQIVNPAALANHYGDDASLSDQMVLDIGSYLTRNAADTSGRTRSQAFSIDSTDTAVNQSDTLPRITQTAYFLRKHDEIPSRMVEANPDVGSFSQCNSCHRGAAEGDYNEHRVSIPNFGRWED